MTDPITAKGRRWQLADEAATARFAKDFGRVLRAPLVINLQGELGAGKTTFARALIQGLGYPGRVKSPTYGLLESYKAGGIDFLHLDLYRIQDPRELEFLAIPDQFTDRGVLLVEWPEKAGSILPSADICMKFKEMGFGRQLEIQPNSAMGLELIEHLPPA